MVRRDDGQLDLDFGEPEKPPLVPWRECTVCHGSGYDRSPSVPVLRRCKSCDYWEGRES